ncbi:MAG: hypothetical protein ACQEWU_06420 [Bacillota bacterium]|uniref:Uncharacterized protein n=1 Tax=Virgibacillus salarius TaxID=447199 RepID=A0A941I9P5_9BACI|nr:MULTISPECIES: hypothetical protein [Virgibacillus]NAZ08481.1 hypothetical protein [Agaribacter marinus]MBR7795768.1 hypothetical protein [Virgibacillus salarius]MCC2248654.1 hypothetical protein [Virgibacillus sp. AGTR]QRZ18407.1 hypothetical protein JUJ52_01235 [Virgibacillus sp. AGTR]WBX81969.1 hypothetical protein PD280_10130 [Virgibacillus salarius]
MLVGITLDREVEVKVSVIDDSYRDSEIPESNKDLSDNPKFDSENKITPYAWWSKDGCFPGGYQHCGGNYG